MPWIVGKMPPIRNRRFAVGEFMRKKRELAIQLATKKAVQEKELRQQQQRVRRLNDKVQ